MVKGGKEIGREEEGGGCSGNWGEKKVGRGGGIKAGRKGESKDGRELEEMGIKAGNWRREERGFRGMF